jgi:hypothetical protein
MATWKRLQGYGDDVTGSFSGTLDSSEFPMAAMVTGANAAAVKSTLSLQNVANESRATILGGNLTGTVDGTAVATVKSGASAGTAAKVVTDAAFDNSNVLKVDNAHANLKNSGISISSAGVLSGAGVGGGTVTKAGIGVDDDDYLNENTTSADVGLENVTNHAAYHSGNKPTKADVGLGSVTNASQATIVAAALSEADADDVGLGNVSNITTAAMRAGVTASDVGLGSVTNASSETIQAAAVATVLGTGTPASLNTLKEIATSLGDNASLSSTLVSSIATKQQAAATGITPANTPTQDVGTIGYDGSGNPWIVVA